MEQNEYISHRMLILIAVVFIGIGGYFVFGGEFNNSRDVLQTPTEGTEAVYKERIKELAKATNILTVGKQCSMDPLVIELTLGEDLTIQNTDTVLHTVAFEDGNFFSVSPGKDRTINIEQTFGKSAGIYRYGCNDISFEENVGVMYVVE